MRRDPYKAISPRISFKQFPGMWFIHDGEVYATQTAPVAIIREAVTGMIHDDMAHELLRKNHLDMVSRWYIFNEAKELKLYRTKIEAGRSELTKRANAKKD
jgi:hypothetical protein